MNVTKRLRNIDKTNRIQLHRWSLYFLILETYASQFQILCAPDEKFGHKMNTAKRKK